MKKLIVGNWKMFGVDANLVEIDTLAVRCDHTHFQHADVLICPPVTLLRDVSRQLAQSSISTGGQDCHAQQYGPFTGDISAAMIQDAGGTHVIVGHSERRLAYQESNALIRQKACAAQEAGLIPIICVGETQQTEGACDVVVELVRHSIPPTGQYVIAYEPVWAIGSGLVPSLNYIATVHAAIRAEIDQDTPILYGGSVKPSNAREILATTHVDGVLVGGSSLKAADFFEIVRATLPT